MWVSVLVRGRRGEDRAGDQLWAIDWTDALTGAAAGLGAKKTRSPPPPHVLLAAQACQNATALRPIRAQNPPGPKPIGTLLAEPRPLVSKPVKRFRKR